MDFFFTIFLIFFLNYGKLASRILMANEYLRKQYKTTRVLPSFTFVPFRFVTKVKRLKVNIKAKIFRSCLN